MKPTDFIPRSAPMDAYLKGTNLFGAEIGVDAGAHAEALLLYCNVQKLVLVDIWDNPFPHAYMLGRLETKGFRNNIEWMTMKSQSAAAKLKEKKVISKRGETPLPVFDFLYFDQLHDYESVLQDLIEWFPLLKRGGIIGYRNYDVKTVKQACDEFTSLMGLEFKIEPNEIIIFK